MYTLNDLESEIAAKIEYMRGHEEEIKPDWVTGSLMADHSDIEGKDADFHLCCSRLSVRKYVTQQINNLESPQKEDENQLHLDGFEHLHLFYVITRKDGRIGVRIDCCTDEELEAKAKEYDSMGRACLAHAKELRRYIEARTNGNLGLFA